MALSDPTPRLSLNGRKLIIKNDLRPNLMGSHSRRDFFYSRVNAGQERPFHFRRPFRGHNQTFYRRPHAGDRGLYAGRPLTASREFNLCRRGGLGSIISTTFGRRVDLFALAGSL